MRFTVFLLFISLGSGAQSDSLLQVILSLQNDTEKVNRLYTTGFSLRNSDPQRAFIFAEACEKSARASGSPSHLAKSYNLLGVLNYKKGDLKTALVFHNKAHELRMKTQDRPGLAISRTNLANIYTDLQQFGKAEDLYLKALETYRDLNDLKRTADGLLNLGALNLHMRHYDAAFEYFKLALDIAGRINSYEIRSSCLNNMAVVFSAKKDYKKAIAYNHDALKIRNMMDNNVEAADSYLNLADNYLKLKDYGQAIENIDNAYRISGKYEYFEGLSEARKTYSEYYAAIGDFEEAYLWLRRYNIGRDSIQLAAELEEIQADNNESLVEPMPAKINNQALLSIVFMMFVFVPLYLFRFKK